MTKEEEWFYLAKKSTPLRVNLYLASAHKENEVHHFYSENTDIFLTIQSSLILLNIRMSCYSPLVTSTA